MESCGNRNAMRQSMCGNPNMNRGCNVDYRRNGQCMKPGCGQSREIRDDLGRSMEVECVCQVKPGCHMEDQMEKLGARFPIAMAYVPWQQWGELYDADCALRQGTIFKELNKVFCGVRC